MQKFPRFLLKIVTFTILFGFGLYFAFPAKNLGAISLYNHVFRGRERLPFGETPRTAYNFSLNNLNAMFASHKIAGAREKSPNKIRVLVIGDSSSWGTLLRPEETLAGKLDGRKLCADDDKTLEVYNLAFPTLSLAKDLLLLNRGLSFGEIDLIIWPLTLESFPVDKQLSGALVNNNLDETFQIFEKSGTKAPWLSAMKSESTVAAKGEKMGDKIASTRRAYADLYRLQLYGFMWAATGIDQDYPVKYPAPSIDLSADKTFHGYEGIIPNDALSWEILDGAHSLAASAPILMVNEPMLISYGKNSDLRYNYYYPRASYDAWRETLRQKASEKNWNFVDLWDFLPQTAFTNSAIHYDADSAEKIAEQLMPEIRSLVCE